MTVKDIQEANGITDPRRLRIGQEIIIPLKPGEGEPTLVPTPTPVALRIQGLAFHRTPVDSLWCLGEVANLSGQPAEEVQVQVSLHDEQGQLLASGAAFIQLDILAAGGRAPFAVLFTGAARQLCPVPDPGPERRAQYPPGAALSRSGRGGRHGTFGWTTTTTRCGARCTTAGDADAEQVAVVVTLYDDEDHVVGARTVGDRRRGLFGRGRGAL